MTYLFSWYYEKDGKHGREAKVFKSEEDIKKFIKENNFDDDETIIDYGTYVSILELKCAEREIEKLEKKISNAIYQLEK